MHHLLVVGLLALLGLIPTASAGLQLSPWERVTLHNVIEAHGILMGIAFVILFPVGALSLRFLRVKGAIWIHAGAQLFAYAVALSAFGMGVWIAWLFHELDSTHAIVGYVVIGLILLQPLLGMIQHVLFVKHRRRTRWSTAHVWLGRAVLLVGAINVALGLQLSENTFAGEIAVGVVMGVVFIVYVAVVMLAHLRKGNGGTAEALEETTQIDGRSESRSGSQEEIIHSEK